MDKVRTFLQSSSVLIVDAHLVSRAFLTKLMVELGAESPKIFGARTAEEACEMIGKFRIDVVVADDSIGTEGVMKVARRQRERKKAGAESVFFYLSGNSSQAIIGRAAEEDIDGFILKPFTRTEFIRVFHWIGQEKLNPNEYQRRLKIGRDLLFSGAIDAAMEEFQKALGLSDQPATARFYLGQAQMMKKALQEAKVEYRAGLGLNQIHCRCLLGMFDVLVTESKTEEAYEVLRRIVSLFPAHPQRLSTALSLAVKTGNFGDVDHYYGFYGAMGPDLRTPDLKNHLCSALAVNGKYHLIRSAPDSALLSFERAVVEGEGQTKFIDYIIETLVAYGLSAEAETFTKKLLSRAKKAA